jgi:hypothetical protein
MKEIRYEVSWKETFAKNRTEFAELEKAREFANIKKGMGYKEVTLKKVEKEEIEF